MLLQLTYSVYLELDFLILNKLTSQIAPGAVTTAKMAIGAVTSGEVADGSITFTKPFFNLHSQ
jgi:hypothetical protein